MRANLLPKMGKITNQVINVILSIVIYQQWIKALGLISKHTNLLIMSTISTFSYNSISCLANNTVIIGQLKTAFNCIQISYSRLLNDTTQIFTFLNLYIPPLFFYTTYKYTKLTNGKGAT